MKNRFNETYLNEAFFDDIEDDIYNDETNTSMNIIYKDHIKFIYKDIIEIIKQCIEIDEFDPASEERNEDIEYNIENNTLYINCPFLENTITIHVDNPVFKEFINNMVLAEVTKIHIINNLETIVKGNNKPIDFKGLYIIGSDSISLESMTPKNLIINNTQTSLSRVYTHTCSLKYCDLKYSNTLSINIDHISLLDIINIKDLNFIHNYTVLSLCNFSNIDLPEGTYKLLLSYSYIPSNPITIINVPSTLTCVFITVDHVNILPSISLKPFIDYIKTNMLYIKVIDTSITKYIIQSGNEHFPIRTYIPIHNYILLDMINKKQYNFIISKDKDE